MEKIFVLPDGVVEPSCYDDGNNILIVIPKETVRFAQENRDDTIIKITDLDSMAKDFIRNFLTFGQNCDEDLGEFYSLLDEWFYSRAEDGVEYIAHDEN